MDTRIDLDFGDGRYSFWLGLPQVVELERKCDKSVFAIYDGLAAGIGLNGDVPVYLGGGTAMLADILETVRLGLIGGGSGDVNGEGVEVGPTRARQLVEAYCYPSRPLTEGMHVAWSILHAAIVGIKLEKKDQNPTGATSP